MAIDIGLTFGAAYIGVILTAFVYGIATLQMYIYWLEPRHDSTAQRLFILSLWLLDTFKLACICHMEYYYGISNHGNPSSLATSTWSLRMQLGLTTVITVMVQGYFAKRAWDFTKQVKSRLQSPRITQITGLLIGILSMAQLGFGLVYFGSTWKFVKFSEGKKTRWLAIAWLASAATCDTLIVYMLSSALIAQRTGYKRAWVLRLTSTDALINKILLYTINTGSLTSIVAIIALILCWSMQNFVYLGPTFMLGTLYIITLLANLNARKADGSKSIYFEDSHDAERQTHEQNRGPETIRSRVNLGPRVEIYRGHNELGVHIPTDRFMAGSSASSFYRNPSAQTHISVPRQSRRTLDTSDSELEGSDIVDAKHEHIPRGEEV